MPSMDAAEVIRDARVRAGLSKRELARRAGTSAAALVEYESGRRDPGVQSLQRILAAAGFEATLVARPTIGPLAPGEAGRRLAEVLELAEHLPHRPAARRLSFPRLAS